MAGGRKTKFLWNSLCGLGLMAGAAPALAGWLPSDGRGTRGPALLNWEPGVRAVGMGGAFVGLADDTGALHENPAGIGQIPKKEGAVSHASEFGEQVRGDLRWVWPVWWKGDRRSWGFRTAWSSVEGYPLVEDGVTTGRANPLEALMSLSYAQPVGPVQVGATAKGIHQNIGTESAWTWAMDLGVWAQFKRLRWGGSISHLGPALDFSSGSTPLPLTTRGGAALPLWEVSHGAERKTLTASFQIDLPAGNGVQPRAGLEYATHLAGLWTAAGRVGLRPLPGTGSLWQQGVLGFGLSHGEWGVNYAFLGAGALGESHRLELVFRWGEKIPQETRRDQLLAETEQWFAQNRLVRARDSVNELLLLAPRHHRALSLKRRIEARFSTSQDPETLMILGEQAFALGRYDAAADYFRTLTTLQADHPDAEDRLLQAQTRADGERLARLRWELERERESQLRSHLDRAREETKNERWPQAIVHWRSVLSLVPDHEEGRRTLLRCRQTAYSAAHRADIRGDETEAEALYRASQDGLATFRDSQSRIQSINDRQAKHKSEQARQLYDQAMREYAAESLRQARDLLERAARLAPEDKAIQKALERLSTTGPLP